MFWILNLYRCNGYKLNMIIIGIDLAGRPDNSTGICILNNSEMNFKVLYSDDEIIDEINELKPDLIVIDAPTSLPRGRCCLEKDCECSKRGGHFREAEVKIRKYGRVLPLTFHGMKMLTKRGINLSKKLKTKYQLIETHPRTVQKMLKIKDVYQYFKDYSNLFSFAEYNSHENISSHELDAGLAVLTGYFYLKKSFIELGDIEEGVIILPDNKIKLNNLKNFTI